MVDISAVNAKPNDLEIVWVPQQSDTDERVPTAGEMARSVRLATQHLQMSRGELKPRGLLNRPLFTNAAKNIVIPGGVKFYSPSHPTLSELPVSHTLTLPNLADTVVSVSRYDRVYLCCFSAIVNAEIDPDLILSYEWRNQSQVLQTVSKENTQRLRDFYAFVWAAGATTENTVLSELNNSGVPELLVSKLPTGVNTGSLRIYPLDPNLLDGGTYKILPESLELIELLRVWRVQNTNQAGYFWGRTGELAFERDFHLQPSYEYVGEGYRDIQNRAHEALYRLMRGDALSDTPRLDRSVQNLVNGQVGINLDAPGIATGSPNGSTALANEQRVTFTNEAIVQTLFARAIVTTDDGNGNAVAAINFAGNSPAGAQFNASGHVVYDASGNDISGDGTFTGGSGTGALEWTGGGSAAVSPGDTVYVIPAIFYPAGSGFPVAGDIEHVYFNATTLNAGNVREISVNDPTSYENPNNSEAHIVVMDKGRAGLAYILKKISITADGNGVVAIPGTARGLIAYISGLGAPATKQDLPVVTGLTASASYECLVYHAPPGSEQWQFQFKAPRYAGTQESLWLNGARVASQPIAIAHSQSGGNTYSVSDGSIQHEVVGFRLPLNTAASAVRGYLFDSKLQFPGEADPGNISFREVRVPFGGGSAGLAQLRPGQVLSVVNAAEAQAQGMAVSLQSESLELGTAKPNLVADAGYQLVVACAVEKDGDYRLLVIALNGGAANEYSYLAYDSDAPGYSAIDTFRLY